MRFAGQGALLRKGQQTPAQPRPWVPAPALDQAGQLTAMFQAFLAQQGLAMGGLSGPTPTIPAPAPVSTPVVAQAPAPVPVVTPVVAQAPTPTPPALVAVETVEERNVSYRHFLEGVLPHLGMQGFIIKKGPQRMP